MKAYMGLDPGQSGSVAVIDGRLREYIALTTTERDIWEFIQQWVPFVEFAILERVSAMPKQGVSSTFKFGTSYGLLRGFLIASGIPFEERTPGVWQRSMGCMSKGDKNVTKRRAQELFPSQRIVHANADAFLLAEYCRRLRVTETVEVISP